MRMWYLSVVFFEVDCISDQGGDLFREYGMGGACEGEKPGTRRPAGGRGTRGVLVQQKWGWR